MPGGVTSQFPGKASNWLLQYNLVSIEDGGMPGWDRDTSQVSHFLTYQAPACSTDLLTIVTAAQPKEPRPGSVGSEGACEFYRYK